jgi:molybdopterin-guanine dinucleotide biosynthesis protein A
MGLSVAILAGGRSRRMGRDKALIQLGRHTLLEVVAQRVEPVADELFVVATDDAPYAALGFKVVPDAFDDAGSLGGIYSAMRHATHDFCLVVACDMPLLNTRLLEWMAGVPRDYDALVPELGGRRSHQGGELTLETLHAIYGRSVLVPFRGRILRGQFKIADALAEVNVQRVCEEEIRNFDPDLLSFFNVNTPDDLNFAEAIFGRGPAPTA